MADIEEAKIKLILLELEKAQEKDEFYQRQQRGKIVMWRVGIPFWIIFVPLLIFYKYYTIAILFALFPILIRLAVSYRIK